MTTEPTQPLSVDGRCLCGDVRYHIEGESFGIIYCHCQRCRKQTGAALVGFAILKDGRLDWMGGREKIHYYRNDVTIRSFCRRCGSAAPAAADDGTVRAIPAGSLVDMDPPMDTWHLFTASKCPWYEIPADEKQYEGVGDGYETQNPLLPNLERHREEDRITGSCLCGSVSYAARNPIRMMNCHCTRCRFSRAAPHATNLFVGTGEFEWRSGADRVERFKLPGAERFTASFCRDCGSLTPTVGNERVSIPAGGLDSDPGMKPAGHIFTGSMARWFEIRDDLPQWTERPNRPI